jgi:alkylated DNA repair dioxygenase AlkB
VEPAAPIPGWLYLLRERAARFAGVKEEALAQVLVTRYPAGAGIGWHRDRPEYGKIVGVSFESPCALRLRRREGAGWRRGSVLLEPRSAYLLDGEVRAAWQHSITPGTQLRYSVTFRTLR